jgi:integrase
LKLPENRRFNPIYFTLQLTKQGKGEKMRQKFYIFKRKADPVYYVRFTNEAGGTLTERSTGCKGRDAAIFTVSNWLRDGLPPNRRRGNRPRLIETETTLQTILKAIAKADTLDADAALEIVKALRERGLINTPAVKAGPGNVDFIGFIEKFWSYDESPYVREKLAHGQKIGRRHCEEMLNRIRLYWVPAFTNKKLNAITRNDLREFSLRLSGARIKPEHYKGRFVEKLSASAINKILIAGSTALNWAYHNELIPHSPAESLRKFSGTSKKRGILTPSEAAEVFAVSWLDKRAYVGNLLAMTCGLRSGEVLALRKSDIGTDGLTLNISHSWGRADGLKCPKNGEERRTPLLPGVRDALADLAGENPWGQDDGFLFYSTAKPDVPMDCKFLLDGLRAAIEAVNTARKEQDADAEIIDWKGRNITYHEAMIKTCG